MRNGNQDNCKLRKINSKWEFWIEVIVKLIDIHWRTESREMSTISVVLDMTSREHQFAKNLQIMAIFEKAKW